MALPSTSPTGSDPHLCSPCGAVMQRGFVSGEAAFAPATISWEPERPPKTDSWSDDSTELAPLPFWRFSSSPRFPANLCTNCKIVEIHYT